MTYISIAFWKNLPTPRWDLPVEKFPLSLSRCFKSPTCLNIHHPSTHNIVYSEALSWCLLSCTHLPSSSSSLYLCLSSFPCLHLLTITISKRIVAVSFTVDHKKSRILSGQRMESKSVVVLEWRSSAKIIIWR